ncbi:MAG: tetratricopeptide repeat protein [Spirochaetaceae bacterium]|nr:tetratricopeptide repeat protein [Spirochaetaceae bacterium]
MSTLKRGFFIYPFAVLLIITSCVSTREKVPEGGEKEKGQEKPVTEKEDPIAFYKGPEDVAKALEIMEELENEQMDRDSRFLYYSLLISNNNIDEAVRQLEILLQENRKDSEVLVAYITLMDYLGDTEKRDDALNSLIAIDGENSFALNMKGTLALRNKNYSEAESLFSKSLRADPQNINSYIGRGNSLMHIKGREEESLAVFDAAEKINSENPYIFSDRSRVLRFLKDYGRAEDDITKAISLYPSEWNYLDRARIRISDLDDKTGAKEDLEEIIAINDSNFFANVYLAGIYDDEKNYDKALLYYEKILTIADDYYYAYPALGKLYYIKGQWDKAAEMYMKASFSKSNEMTYPLMAYICYTYAGNDRKAKSIVNDNIGNLDRNSSIYEMYRYYLNPSSAYFVQLAIDKDENEFMRNRMKYYLAMIDKINGRVDTAAVILHEIAVRKGAPEFELASIELEKK